MMWYIVSIIFGALVGSFLNVCIFRLPKEESIVWPGSHCPHCNNPIKFYDNIPLVSYILLKGECRHCHSPISFQYPLIEGITAFTSLILFMKFGPSLSYLFYFLFVAALIVITVIDLYHSNHPDVISLPGIGVGLLASLVLPQITLFNSLLGDPLSEAGSLFLVATLYQWLFTRGKAWEWGDVKSAGHDWSFPGMEIRHPNHSFEFTYWFNYGYYHYGLERKRF